MEVFSAILIAFITAALLAAIFSYGFKTKGPWGSFWTFFLILFLTIWAAEFWVTPIGPAWGYWDETAWLPLVMIGVLMALILAAATPPRREVPHEPGEPESQTENAIVAVVGVFFWISIVVLAALIIAGLVQVA